MKCRSISFQLCHTYNVIGISCSGIFRDVLALSRDISPFAARSSGTIRSNPNQLIRHWLKSHFPLRNLRISISAKRVFKGTLVPGFRRAYFVLFVSLFGRFFSHFHYLFPWQSRSVTSKCLSLARPRSPGRTKPDTTRRTDGRTDGRRTQRVMATQHVCVCGTGTGTGPCKWQYLWPSEFVVVIKRNNNINSRHSQHVISFLCAKTKAGAGRTQPNNTYTIAVFSLDTISPWT